MLRLYKKVNRGTMEVTMLRQNKKIALGAILLVLFSPLAGHVVSAEEAKVVFGVA
jgi:hypothetical protein